MDIENSSYTEHSDQGIRSKENGNHHSNKDHVNGISNGYSDKQHKSHKDKHRDKDRDKSSSSSKHKSSSRDKDHRHSSSSSSKDKHKSSSRDKERSSNDKHRDKSKDDRKSSSSGSKEHKSSSSTSKEHRDKSSSSSRDKHRHSSSSKDKDRHSSSNNTSHKSSSSSSRDKDRHHSSSTKDKEHYRDKEKQHSSDRNNYDSSDAERRVKPEPVAEVKREEFDESVEEVDSGEDLCIVEPEVKQESDDVQEDDDSQDARNQSHASSCDYNLSAFKTEPEDSEEDAPLTSRMDSSSGKRKFDSEDDDEDMPLTVRKKVKTESSKSKKKKRSASTDSEDDVKPVKKEKKKKSAKVEVKTEHPDTGSPKKRKKKPEDEQEVWKWWEEEKKDDGTKWNFLEHKGPVFAPLYEPLPANVKFSYDGREVRLSEEAEEVAGFYAKMLDHDYTTKDIFNTNFFKDWRKVMTDKERALIVDLRKCNFKSMHAFYMDQAEKNRNRTKEEKAAIKAKNEEILKEYGFCTIDGHKEKIGNFKIEPPGLFRGRGEHPKMGMLKRRVLPEDVMINCSKKSKIPVPPAGHKWKEVRHDSQVTWLASWTENVQNQVKYIMLNPSSKLKGEKDWQKYETARKLAKSIEKIRKEYREDWKSKEMRIRQRAVALYFIDKLALRAGNEKDEDQADTVGCCSLRVEHITLHEQKDDKEYVVVFDFLGKDSIRYYNEVPVEKRVFKNLQLFMENKSAGDDLFDRLNTQIMNKHLNELMEGLTAKVFRTYNASWTLQQQLDELTNEGDTVAEKILSYNRANRAVAILCNHQRSVPKGHAKSMEKLKEKIEQKKDSILEMERQVQDAQRQAKRGSVKEKVVYDKKKKALEKLKEQLVRLNVQETDKDENKSIALGTSKLNYLDPRISVAWCKKYNVPIEKIYNKTQRDKFRWAIDMAGPEYIF
ncbi:Topoisomerase 1 [Carabus blaptoides fortunei]